MGFAIAYTNARNAYHADNPPKVPSSGNETIYTASKNLAASPAISATRQTTSNDYWQQTHWSTSTSQ
jgi:hypothetical protein